jgi:MFS family permease
MAGGSGEKVTTQVGGDAPTLPYKSILFALCLAQFINAYDTTAMNVAVSSVVKSLHTTVTGVQTALVTYSLVMAAFMLIGAKLGDIWGRRAAFLIGVGVYGCGALITALSPGLPVMVLGWSFLEGLGSALMIPAIYAIIGSTFPAGKTRIMAFATVGATAAMGAALGPLVCGALTTFLTWRVSFAMEVCVVIICIFLSLRIKVPKSAKSGIKFDVLGAVLSAVGLALVVMGVLQASKFGWLTAREPLVIAGRQVVRAGGLSPVIPFVVVGIIVLVGFAFWERHMHRSGKSPLLDVDMLAKRAVLFGLLAIIALMFMQSGFLFVAPVFMQMGLGYSAFHSGLLVLPLTIAVILVASRVGKITAIFAAKRIVQVGMLITSVGIVLLAMTLKSNASQWQFLPGMIVTGVGLGLVNAPLMNLTQGAVAAEEQSEISGLSRAMSNLGGAFGTAVAGAVLMASMIGTLTVDVQHSTLIAPVHKATVIEALRKDAQTVSNAEAKAYWQKLGKPANVVNTYVTWNAQARDKGLRIALYAVGVIGLFGFVVSCFLPYGKPKKAPAAAKAQPQAP